MYLINRTRDTCSRRWVIMHGFQDLALLMGPGLAPMDRGLRRRSFNTKSTSQNISGTWEQKESAELAPATSSASRDGAISQILVPWTLGTSSWWWCPHWQAAVTLAEQSVGSGKSALDGKILGTVASSTDISTFASLGTCKLWSRLWQSLLEIWYTQWVLTALRALLVSSGGTVSRFGDRSHQPQ